MSWGTDAACSWRIQCAMQPFWWPEWFVRHCLISQITVKAKELCLVSMTMPLTSADVVLLLQVVHLLCLVRLAKLLRFLVLCQAPPVPICCRRCVCCAWSGWPSCSAFSCSAKPLLCPSAAGAASAAPDQTGQAVPHPARRAHPAALGGQTGDQLQRRPADQVNLWW